MTFGDNSRARSVAAVPDAPHLAALHPERVRGLVSVDGYMIQDVAHGADPGTAADERARWYVHLFQTETGRRALEQDREDICSLLWRDWSPTWAGVTEAFLRTAPSLHNPDFVDTAIHAYRHRHGATPSAPEYAEVVRLPGIGHDVPQEASATKSDDGPVRAGRAAGGGGCNHRDRPGGGLRIDSAVAAAKCAST